MRRRSLVGPILLVLIGVLFLANNLRPEIPLFQLLSTYWPFLLIGWGVLRLIEILLDAARSRPLPATGLSGGEVLLIAFICLAGSSLYTLNRHGNFLRMGLPRGLEVFGEPYDYPISQQKPAGRTPRIVFENLKGNIRVSGGDEQEIRITGHKTVRAFSRSDADQVNQDTPVEIIGEGDHIVVRTNQERVAGHWMPRRARLNPERWSLTADLDVTVPRGASVEAHGRYGDFEVSDILGSVDISSDNAGVRLSKIGGDARIETRKSDIIRAVDVKGNVDLQGRGNDIDLQNILGQVTVNGSYSGTLEFQNLAKPLHFESRQTDLRVEALPGRISMDLGDFTAKNLVGPIRLITKSRDVKIEEFTQSLDLETERGDIELRPLRVPLAKIDVRSRAGNINLSLPESARFDLKASTSHGEARNEFGPPIQIEINGHSSSLKGSVDHGPAVNITTERGTVAVRKS